MLSLTLGSVMTAICSFFIKYTPSYIFGVSITLWCIALVINLIDIHTGIKADTKIQNDKGLPFVFKSGRGWRAIEKVFIFTMIIWFIWGLEKEAIRLQYSGILTTTLLVTKFIILIYTVLIEIQSIGENEVVRFGKKGKLFLLLDKVIEVVNEGILKRLTKAIS
jgi:hypothetical protein